MEYFQQGLIIGNNVNIEHGVYQDESDDKKDEKKEKFDGALVADPTLNSHTGIPLYGSPSKYIFDNVVDMDFSSMYPHIIIAFNIAPNCMIGKLIIDRNYKDIYNQIDAELEGKVEDLGKDFVDNMITNNVGNMATKWFGLPGMSELDSMLRSEFNLNKKHLTVLESRDVNKYYVEPLIINLGDDLKDGTNG